MTHLQQFFIKFRKMSHSYQIIVNDLMEAEENNQTFPVTPYLTEMSYTEKLNVTYDYLKRAVRLKQCISSLVFSYFLGQLIENKVSSKREIKQIVTEHYYIISIRVYYLFEFNSQQIYATKMMTIMNVRKLKQDEFKQLVIEL